ncbi:hypothetical protein ACQ4WP_27465 [Janthinobacterium sp. GB4P2]|uniref:hypothetical protein n=1 Tax=Janthinobacterium sp. GB4P2 TaxID=3424189 RepID=UPI003F23C2E3
MYDFLKLLRGIRMGRATFWGAIGFAVCGVLAGALVVHSKYDDWFVFPPYRKLVSVGLLDPLSAQFRGEKIVPGDWACGELNAKNGSGGYVGFKRYLISKDGYGYLEDHGRLGDDDNFDRNNERVTEELDAEIKINENTIETYKITGKIIKLSKSELRESIRSLVFERRWKEKCSS